MTAFALSGLLAGVTSLILGFFVLFNSTDKKIRKIWFYFTLSVGGWGFASMWMGSAKSAQEALFCAHTAYFFGVVWTAPLFYHFVRTFLELKQNKSIYIHYLIGFAFLPALPTRWFFLRVDRIWDSLFYPRAGILLYGFFCWWTALVIYSHFLLFRAFKDISSIKRHQIKYFFFATVIGYTGGSLCYLPNFGIDIYPWGNFAVFLYPIIMSYAILKHQLMDINIVIRKTLIYSCITAGLGALYVGTMTLLVRLIEIHLPSQPGTASALAASLFGLQWLRKVLQSGFVYGCMALTCMSLALGIFAWWRGRRKPANRLWFWMCFSVAMWGFGLGMMVRSHSYQEADFWQTWFLYTAASMIPTVFLHFVSLVVNQPIKKTLIVSYVFSFLIIGLNIGGRLATVLPKPPFQFYTEALPAYYSYFVFFMVVATYAHILLARKFLISEGRMKEQIRYIVMGTAIGFLAGSTSFLYSFNIRIFPYGVYFVPIYTLTVSYAIYKHQLMDINVVIRRTLVYSVLSAILVCIYVTTITLLAYILGAHKGSVSPLSSAIAAAAITLLFNPIRVRIQHFVDRHFSREAVDQTVLREITGAFVHEIKTPLSNIALPAELTLMDMDDLQQGKATPAALIPKIKKRMQYIMEQALLAGSKVEAVREATTADDIARSTASLEEVFRNSLKQMRQHLRASKVQAQVEGIGAIGPVRASAKQLEVVFGNLIKNAAEAMAESKGARRLNIAASQNDGQVIVTVADTGPGIRPADLPHVFDSHYSTKGSKGAGVGLTLCRQIIEAHKGTIEVESQPGLGATFTIKLPKSPS